MAALISIGAVADNNSWTAIGPYGGRVLRIAYNFQNPSIVYLLSNAGFSRSTDGGASWQMVDTDIQRVPLDMAVDPTNPNNVYVLTSGQPYFLASSDAGKTMKPQGTLPVNQSSPWALQVAADGKTLYVTVGATVLASTDGGKSWVPESSFSGDGTQYVFELAADPRDAATLFASVVSQTGNGIFVTHDGARTWAVSTWSTDPSGYATDIAIDPSDSNTVWCTRGTGVWVTHDRGTQWTHTSFNAPASANAPTLASVVTIDPHNSSSVYAANPWGVLMHSSDGGANWTDVTGNARVSTAFTIAVNPADSRHVLYGGIGSVWATTNEGSNWSLQISGLLATGVGNLSANPATDRIYMDTEDGTIAYLQGGAPQVSLINQDALRQLNPVVGSFGINSMVAVPGIGGRLLASLTTGMATSTDGGDSWSLALYPAPNLRVMAAWPNGQNVLVSGDATQYRSIDGGHVWTLITGLPVNTRFSRLATAPSDPNVAYAAVSAAPVAGPAPNYGLYKTLDAGLTWAPTGANWPPGIIRIAVDPSDAQTIYVSTGDHFLKSTTGGMTFADAPWDSSTLGALPYAFTIDPVNPRILYAAADAGIIRSVDGGQSWQVLPPSPFSPVYNNWSALGIMLDPNRHNDVLVAAFYDGAYKLTVAPDLSLSAKQPTTPAAAGATLLFTYSATNKGPYDATGVKLVVELPASATNVAGQIDAGECTTAGSVVTCTAPVLRNGATASILVNAVAAAAGEFTAHANLSADQPDPDTNNNAMTTAAPTAPSSPPAGGSSTGGGSTGGSSTGGSSTGGSETGGNSASSGSGGGGAFSAPWLLGLVLLMLARGTARRFCQS